MSDHDGHDHDGRGPEEAEERSAVHEHQPEGSNARTLALLGIGLLLVIALTQLGVWALFRAVGRRPSSAVLAEGPLPPAAGPARAWVNPGGDLAAYRRQEQLRIDGYRWIDREAGVVQLPIARAMELLLERQGSAEPASQPAGTERRR